MPDAEGDLEADLEKELGGDANPAGTPEVDAGAPKETPTQPSTEDQVFFEAAGRKFKTKEEAQKFVDHHYRGYSKIAQEKKELEARYEKWRKYEEVLKSDPDRYKAIRDAEAKYLAERGQGATKKEAEKASGLDPAAAQRLEALEKWKAEREERDDASRFETEEKDFRSKNPSVTDEQMAKVYDVMLEAADNGRGVEISFDLGLRLVRAQELDAENKKLAEENRRVKTDADLGGSNHAAAGSKGQKSVGDVVRHGSDAEYDKLLDSQLGGS